LVVLSIFNNKNHINNNAVIAEVDFGEGDNANLTNPKSSAFWTMDYIHIDGNWSDTVNEDWCSGDGSWDNPYVIENVTIDASSSPTGSGIFINNSKNDYFIIRNVTVYNAGGDAGIKLENTNNGSLTNNNCSNNGQSGVFLYDDCGNNTISGNIVNNNWFGILLQSGCDNNTISGNIAYNNDEYGIFLLNCDNNTISGNIASNVGTTNQDTGIYLEEICNNNTI